MWPFTKRIDPHEKLRKEIAAEPVVQHNWYVYKCRMCGEKIEGVWSANDEVFQEGYITKGRVHRRSVDLIWWSEHRQRFGPQETIIHACTETEAGIADLLGAACKPMEDLTVDADGNTR